MNYCSIIHTRNIYNQRQKTHIAWTHIMLFLFLSRHTKPLSTQSGVRKNRHNTNEGRVLWKWRIKWQYDCFVKDDKKWRIWLTISVMTAALFSKTADRIWIKIAQSTTTQPVVGWHAWNERNFTKKKKSNRLHTLNFHNNCISLDTIKNDFFGWNDENTHTHYSCHCDGALREHFHKVRSENIRGSEVLPINKQSTLRGK